jgi:hypothetical protein
VAESDESGLVKSVEDLLAERQAVADREKKLIADLNSALGKMGYKVVSAKSTGGNESPKKPGRPPGSGKGQAPKAATP